MSYIDVKYYIETIEEPEKVIEKIAGIQSIGILKNINSKLRKRISSFKAKVKEIQIVGIKNKYELPTRFKEKKKVKCVKFKLSFPIKNFSGNIAQFLTSIAGEVFDLKELTAIKVLDVNFTDEFLKFFNGPKFGIEGIRKIIKVEGRPLFGAIVKPCLGLTPKEIARLVFEVGMAGADFIKDDELLEEVENNLIKNRVKAVSEALNKVYEKTGKIVMYAFNITDYPDRIFLLHDTVKKYGGKAIMYNVLSGGFPLLKKLADYTELPIHCHRDFSVAIFRCKYLGISSKLFTKITRLCGGDMIQCGGIGGSLYENDEEVLENFTACTEEFSNIKKALPVTSGGQSAKTLHLNLKKIKSNDFLFLSGSGVFDDPKGGYYGMKKIIEYYGMKKIIEKYQTILKLSMPD